MLVVFLCVNVVQIIQKLIIFVYPYLKASVFMPSDIQSNILGKLDAVIDKTVAKHEDINDENQTVTFTKETPPDEKVKTGAGILVAILMGFALGFGGAGIYTLRRKKKFF